MRTQKNLKTFSLWFGSLKSHKATGGPAKGTIAVALVLLEHLKDRYDLNLESHRAPGKSQIKGTGGAAIKRILARFGETRPYLSEGGRTNRGGPGEIEKMLKCLRAMGLEDMNVSDRSAALNGLQAFLVDKVRESLNRQRIRIAYNPSKTVRQAIQDLLEAAVQTGKEGPVAQHLVGAKLTLRFPQDPIENRPFSSADAPRNLPGDFVVGDTAFHVTVAPMEALFQKCRENLDAGFCVFVLVPERKLAVARDHAESIAFGQIETESLESFVAQNIQEMSKFSRDQTKAALKQLFEAYNDRVDQVEPDKSLMLVLPKNL